MPELIVFCGLPGTGKTHQALILERKTGAVRLSRDEIRAGLFSVPTYDSEEKAVCFGIMLKLAEYHLRRGQNVILDGMPFSKRIERDAALRIADSLGAKFRLYQCVCAEHIALARIASQPDHLAKDRGETLYRRVQARFDPILPEENAENIDTGV